MPRSHHKSQAMEDSWRMVDDGEQGDSSVVPAEYDSSDIAAEPQQVPSSFDSSLGSSSQSSSGKTKYRFQPTIPESHRRRPPSPVLSSPEPQLMFPKVDVDSSWTAASRSRTVGRADNTTTRRATGSRARTNIASGRFGRSVRLPRRRNNYVDGEEEEEDGAEDEDEDEDQPKYASARQRHRGVGDRLTAGFAHGLLDMVGWMFKVFSWALRILAPVFSILLAVLLLLGIFNLAWQFFKPSIGSFVSPICRIPGIKLLDIPLCQDDFSWSKDGFGKGFRDGDKKDNPIEFDDLMSVQSQLETVLEKSSSSVSLPLEMKRSESTIRDLRSLVKVSRLAAKDSLALELDGFIGATSKSADGLTRFTVAVGTTVDRILIINKHTLHYINELLPPEIDSSAGSTPSAQIAPRELVDIVLWSIGLRPHPSERARSHERLRQKYIEHTMAVSDRIETLVVQAQAVLRDLSQAEGHLEVILEIVHREKELVEDKQLELQPSLWTLWGLVGGQHDRRERRSLKAQIDLLAAVRNQRSIAVNKLNSLVVDLKEMQLRLADLRDRVEMPAFAANADDQILQDPDEVGFSLGSGRSSLAEVPLKVHIETINYGVERLEEARRRIKTEENDRIQETLDRGAAAFAALDPPTREKLTDEL